MQLMRLMQENSEIFEAIMSWATRYFVEECEKWRFGANRSEKVLKFLP